MSDFEGLDLQAVEDELEGETDGPGRVELGVLDGTTDPESWAGAVADGSILVLDVDGELNDLASGFARDIQEMGGNLMHFRGFLLVTPPGVSIDTDRL
jgi:hypothetical protein